MVSGGVVRKALEQARHIKSSFRYGIKFNRMTDEPQQFVDNIRVRVCGGFGGNGYPSLKGIGGNGGSVIFAADESVQNLSLIKEKYPHLVIEADSGKDSLRHWLVGESATDTIVQVPCGVKVYSEHGSPLGDLLNHNDKVTAAFGGLGGVARNRYFGEPGQNQRVTLDYRALADVSLIGFPNAGKSLLYKKLTKSKADGLWIKGQLFHTHGINLSSIRFPDMREISCVDLPGLIEGSDRGRGVGNKFLKHLDRNQLLLFLVDVKGFHLGKRRKAIETLLVLNQQVESFDDRYLQKPAIIIVNKLDLENGSLWYEDFLLDLKRVYDGDFENLDPSIIKPRRLLQYQDIIPISCARENNLDYLQERIRELIDFNYRLSLKNSEAPQSFSQIIDQKYNALRQGALQLT